MKKIIYSTFFICFFCCTFSFANEVDGTYRKQILNNGYAYNTAGFIRAIQKENTKVITLFIEAGMNPNITFSAVPAPMFALYKNKSNSLNTLLDAGANVETEVPAFFVSVKPQNLLSYAIKKKNTEAVITLVKHNVDVNKEFNGEIPLNRAIKNKQIEIVKILINAKAIPNNETIKLVKTSKNKELKVLFP